jgi:hypothetical protein
VAVAVGVFAVAVLGLSLARLRFGVDLSDESYYLALAMRFVYGDRPFVDEQNVGLLGALFTTPFVWVWYHLFGLSGAVLALRGVYAAMSVGVGVVGYRTLKAFVPRSVAVLAAVTPLAFVPYALPAPRYNTIAVAAAAVSALLLVYDTGGPPTQRRMFLVGLFASVAAVVYPSLVLLYPVVSLAGWWLYPDARRSNFLALSAGYALGAFVLVLVVLQAGVDALSASLEYTHSSHGSDYVGRIEYIWRDGVVFVRTRLMVFAALGVLAVLAATMRRARGVFVLAGVVACGLGARVWDGYIRSVELAILVTVFAIVLLAVPIVRGEARRRLGVALAVAVTVGATVAFSSTGALKAVGVALLVGAPFWPVVFYRASVDESADDAGSWREIVALLSCAVLVTFGLAASYAGTYRDAPIPELTETVPDGPFAGLRTTPERAASIRLLQEDLATTVAPDDRILVFDRLPAGYLLADARPATNSVWLSVQPEEAGSRNSTLAYYERTGIQPTVALVRTGFDFVYPPVTEAHALREYVSEPVWRREVVRPDYEIWRRVGE